MKNSVVRRGFTLIELLVVMTIIGILVGLTLPAVNIARESARRMVCVNNITQISRAFTAHVAAQGFFPTGGWGYWWVGEPDCGYGSQQPGGWLFSILDYLEQGNIRNQGLGLDGGPRADAIKARMKNPIPIINCPTRRTRNIYPTKDADVNKYMTQAKDHSFVGLNPNNPTAPIQSVQQVLECIKGDYATNAGTFGNDFKGGDLAVMVNAHSYIYKSGKTLRGYAMESVFDNANSEYGNYQPYSDENYRIDKINANLPKNEQPLSKTKGLNGISFLFSEVTLDEVEDGLANTYMVGEKYLNTAKYIVDNNDSNADNESAYDGADNDNQRICSQGPGRDRKGSDWTEPFGSAHAISFNMAFCDGSVRRVNYNINTEIHWKLCNRRASSMTCSAFSGKIDDWSAISDD